MIWWRDNRNQQQEGEYKTVALTRPSQTAIKKENMFVQNAGTYAPNYTASHHRRLCLSNNDTDRQLHGKLIISPIYYIHSECTMKLYYVVYLNPGICKTHLMNIQDFWDTTLYWLVNSYRLLFTDIESYCRSLKSAQEPHTSNLTLTAYAWESSQYHKFNYHINREIGVMYYNTHVTKFSDTIRAQCFVLTPNTKSMPFHFILDL